jgi:hypothetical protein
MMAGKKYEHVVVTGTDADILGRQSTPEKPECPLQDRMNELGDEGYVTVAIGRVGSYIIVTMAREVE